MGFQVQESLPTIELELVNAIKKVTDEDVKIYASGRTDKGVHAYGQVIHFDTEASLKPYGWKKALNSFLPPDIRIVDIEFVDDSFHARFSATMKEYHYLIKYENYTVFDRNYYANFFNLDIDLMKEALKHFEGTHNFKGFCSASVDPRKDFVKTIFEASLEDKNGILTFVFKGTGFLKYQIRRMMGLIIEIGLHKDSIDTIERVFEEQDPQISHMKAPSEGLYLYKVYY